MKKRRSINPFKEFQKQRIQRNIGRIQAAIEVLRDLKAPITYSAVARLAEMTLSGIRKNSRYVMLIETAKAQVSAHIQQSPAPENEEPRTLEDARALLRILRAKNRSLAHRVNLQAKVFKRYNLQWSEGNFIAVPTEQATRQLEQQQVELLRRIITIILDDKVYTLTTQGIVSPLNGKPIVPQAMLQAASLQEL
ncbi:MAG: hypothetical protein DMG06_23425 [Acidobacteria bacterium]|nr:MAG: hypothetical protein DMG06_23425 [Acidobacteriota bacterium]